MLLAFALNALLMVAAGVEFTALQNFLIVMGHTVVSVIRNYVIRRWFNRGLKHKHGELCNAAELVLLRFGDHTIELARLRRALRSLR